MSSSVPPFGSTAEKSGRGLTVNQGAGDGLATLLPLVKVDHRRKVFIYGLMLLNGCLSSDFCTTALILV